MEKVSVLLKIRRYDKDQQEILETTANFDASSEYNNLKKALLTICEIEPEDGKIIKLRCENEVLVPLSFLMQSPPVSNCYYVDVCNVNNTNKDTPSLLQDAYINSVCEKLHNMESRIAQAELLLPQLEWRQQSYMEDTVNSLTNRVSFLNRRIDELLPPKWKSKMAQSKM